MWRTKNRSQLTSYKSLRKLIGILGILLPLICYLGGRLFASLTLQPSISAYYFTNARDFFVGLLVAVALFLMTYKGYEVIDNVITNVTGIAGFGIAIFPCLPLIDKVKPVGFFQLNPCTSNIIHLSCAGTFFTLLAINSIFLFTLTKDKRTMTRNKKRRNVVYITCGIAIIVSLIILVLAKLIPGFLAYGNTVFILETIMLFAFGISWLVKGEAVLEDKK